MIQLKLREAMSIAESDVRSDMIMRLYEAGKAAYSDLLDSAGVTDALGSRENFNYHLNFLLDNSLVVKEGMIYNTNPPFYDGFSEVFKKAGFKVISNEFFVERELSPDEGNLPREANKHGARLHIKEYCTEAIK